MSEERLYMIYKEERDGLTYLDDERTESSEEAVEKGVEKGFLSKGKRFVVIAEGNMGDVIS